MASAHQQLQVAPQSGLDLFDKAECVGRGSYGAVYRGVNRQTGEVVALKVIDLDHPDNEDIGEIQREVALLSQLPDAASHNITLYHGCWVAGHELWIAMDYASGGSIRTLMKAGPIEERFSVLIVREVLVALAFLHTQQIIHRDIKAANILLTQTGKIILADFGVAAHLSTNSKRSTFIGTPYWMAPEVITDGKLYDTKADIWSLGITLYEIANGNPPLTQYEPLRAIAMIPRATPPTLEGDEWTPAMKDFMALCLTLDPNDRPNAEELTRSKWIRSAARVPTSLLRELIVRYGGWVSAGGVRMSIIDNVAKRDDTFEFDTTRASWIFENEDQFEGLGDEPYNDRTQIGRKSSIVPPPHHPLMRLFDEETEIDPAAALNGYTSQIEIPGMGGNSWGASADTLRPNSINIPDFDSGDAVSAFAPASTPWFMASATSVGSTEPDTPFGNFDDDDSGPTRFGVAFDTGDPDESTATIQMPSHDATSPNTVRPGFASGISAFNPNPWPKRSRQQSTDSVRSNGPFGDLASGPSFSSFIASSNQNSSNNSTTTPDSPTSDGWDFGRTDSPDSMSAGRANVAQSPSLPMLATNARRDQSPAAGDRHNGSPRSPAGANRMRSNTAPNFDSQHGKNASSPQEASPAKNVLSFSSRSPFGGAARPPNQRRPTALNLSESSNSLDPHLNHMASDDNLLTPMPTISPVSPSAAETPTSSGFPFPSSTSQSSISRTATARSTSTAATSISEWPRGPSLQPLDYSSLSSRDEIEAQLQVLLQNLGQWLSSADQGMAILAEAC